MDYFLYLLIFCMGTVFGSFFTLAVYRIPLRQDIVHTHSYCPNCNHKLGLLDLFPIFSYIFLLGKCRYCKQKIRPRYLILEILSGLLFVAMAYAMKLNIYTLNVYKIIEICFMVLYLTFIVLIAGIDKENRNMEKAVNVYGIVISIIYMIYLCIVEKANIYRYVIYLALYILVLVVDTITLKRYAKNRYVDGILLMLITMLIYSGEYVTINAIIWTLLAVSIYTLIHKMKEKKNRSRKTDKQITEKISIGFYLGITNVISLLVVLFCSNYIL